MHESAGRPEHKLLIEEETRWKSTILMLQHEAAGAARASLLTYQYEQMQPCWLPDRTADKAFNTNKSYWN